MFSSDFVLPYRASHVTVLASFFWTCFGPAGIFWSKARVCTLIDLALQFTRLYGQKEVARVELSRKGTKISVQIGGGHTSGVQT